MNIPEHYSSEGNSECEQRHAIVFDNDPDIAVSCPLQGFYEKQFGYYFTDNPFFNDPVPQGSQLQEHVLKFGKQVELAFA